MERWIMHVDMDAFYAAVEQRDNPHLMGKPVIVGGESDGRGVVATCSYEARHYGVRSAMPMFQAKRLCPDGVFLKPRFSAYQQASQEIRQIFHQFTPVVEPLSIDEAFLDITGSLKLFGSLEETGNKIKSDIKRRVNLAASVGIANNKFLAKLASDWNKPDGFLIINPWEAEEFLTDLPVSRIWGIGAKTSRRLAGEGVKTIGDLQQMSLAKATQLFGNSAQQMLELARGIDFRPVLTNQPCKSMGNEITFNQDYGDKDFLNQVLLKLAEKISRRLRQHQLQGTTVTLKLKYSDFTQITRSVSIKKPVDYDLTIYNIGKELLAKEKLYLPVRLIGLAVSNFSANHDQQLSFFDEEQEIKEKITRLTKVLDSLKDKHGEKIIGRGIFAAKGNYVKK
jgi:DNA polymerase-4